MCQISMLANEFFSVSSLLVDALMYLLWLHFGIRFFTFYDCTDHLLELLITLSESLGLQENYV